LIEDTIKYCETILGRKLTDHEILVVGISYQQGLLRGLQEKEGGASETDQR
jgi:hypothetical protein